jgi:hypothetical protein
MTLRHMAGSNYQAGYAFAATLIAIAEGGEAGSSGDSHWATVRDGIWLAARAMGDNGAPVAGIGRWANSLLLRFAHGLTPSSRKTFPAGDVDITTPNIEPTNGALLAVIAGQASEQSKAWARKFNADLGLSNENPLFDGCSLVVRTTSSSIRLRTGVSRASPATPPPSILRCCRPAIRRAKQTGGKPPGSF